MVNNVINIPSKNYLKIVVSVIIVIIALAVIFSSAAAVPAGFVGIRTQFGAVSGNALPAGLNFKVPFIQQIDTIDCRIQKIEAEAIAASKDLQTVTSKIAVSFAVNPKQAVSLYRDIGTTYRNVIIEPAIQEVVKMVTAQFTAEELIAKRGEVSTKMTKALSDKIISKGMIINDFNVINFDFSPEFNKAIELKQVAQQQALKASQDLERIKIEAEQKIVQAQAEASSLRLQKQEISAELLRLREIEAQLRAIEKWDGKLPTYTGGDSVPFIDINPTK